MLPVYDGSPTPAGERGRASPPPLHFVVPLPLPGPCASAGYPAFCRSFALVPRARRLKPAYGAFVTWVPCASLRGRHRLRRGGSRLPAPRCPTVTTSSGLSPPAGRVPPFTPTAGLTPPARAGAPISDLTASDPIPNTKYRHAINLQP